MTSTLSSSANLSRSSLDALIYLRRELTFILYLKVISSILSLTTLLFSMFAVSEWDGSTSLGRIRPLRDLALLI
jgi:hypothetical protein